MADRRVRHAAHFGVGEARPATDRRVARTVSHDSGAFVDGLKRLTRSRLHLPAPHVTALDNDARARLLPSQTRIRRSRGDQVFPSLHTPGTRVELASMPEPNRHFSMLRDFRAADFFTLGNGLAGSGAILAFMRYCASEQPRFFWLGAGLLPIALLMDILDGRVARLRNEASPLGQELDSLADVVSFGVAPAAMAFTCGLRGEGDALCLMYFVACGISRLARYNVTAAALSNSSGKVRYFEGMPIPSSLLLVALWAILFGTGHYGGGLPLSAWKLGPISLHPLALLYVAHGSAMISKTLRIPKL